MLFSGLGDIEEAQKTLSIGVGALAGSTIMLLTVPWALCIFAGKVDFSGPEEMPNYKGSPKLRDTSTFGALTTTGVALTPEIHHGAKMMMLTTLPYFLIQVPALFLTGDREEVSAGEHYWALAGFIMCTCFFIYYLYTQVKMSNDTAHKLRRMAIIKDSLKKGAVSLSGALSEQVKYMERESLKRGGLSSGCALSDEGSQLIPSTSGSGNDGCSPCKNVSKMLKGILGEAFRGYDTDGNGTLSKKEFSLFLTDFHETITPDYLDSVFSQFDRDGNNTIDFDEFISACYVIIKAADDPADHPEINPPSGSELAHPVADRIFHDEGEDEEEEDLPEDLANLTPEQQQSAIKRRAFFMLFMGTALVLLFSDPMVEVLSEVAERIDVPPFYVSFILAPLASNASEVIASQYYAAKKTRKTITVALTALEGAASMNNTFCLAIFMALIFFRGLAWQYTAETISIILVQLIMGVWCLRDKMSSFTAIIVFSIFPLSVLFVALLEYLGLD
mmetsp:Transcript_34487/g.63387  ORF Transcript_34487/g.63387 Transcript_34487/m.63387 type:complete len:503 (-) Transcript_34487:210-1718(-)|eukprot:CAMPEP_0201626798 /NCGR_PEP_ID=MMETSP0493-20130528/2014_1 /ASSEMBLY_ACC=CAM_ASM_000838 /TAXON_ID=420259 /ORGANISM="Thalassiosira gravida, Strain GMp14c1" /LENGTH=502 /DNA_ID=CAMNT_0048096909 /DNA_START=306 /DNA_END=1814 /DNA_ORIENTATION=-